MNSFITFDLTSQSPWQAPCLEIVAHQCVIPMSPGDLDTANQRAVETGLLIAIEWSQKEASQALTRIGELQRMPNSLRQKLATRH